MLVLVPDFGANRLIAPVDCTYDQPSNRRRNPAPQYIEAIESRLHRAEALLKSVLPDVDLGDPKLDNDIPQRLKIPTGFKAKAENAEGVFNNALGGDNEKDSLLESMVHQTGSLELDDRGYWDFTGHSSGLEFLRRMEQHFGDLMGAEPPTRAFLPDRPAVNHLLDSPRSLTNSPVESNMPSIHDLPSKEIAQELCENALDDASALMRFVHQPTFYAIFNRIYDTPAEHFGYEENQYLPLLYAMMAVGSLFAKSETSRLGLEGYHTAVDQGLAYGQMKFRSMAERAADTVSFELRGNCWT